jgi:hypothetical protein
VICRKGYEGATSKLREEMVERSMGAFLKYFGGKQVILSVSEINLESTDIEGFYEDVMAVEIVGDIVKPSTLELIVD